MLPKALSRVEAGGLGQHPGLLIAVGVISALLLLAGLVFLIYYLRLRRPSDRPTQPGPKTLTPTRLRELWERFLAPLPATVRAALPEYDHFIVLGDPGAGKSATVTRRVDWQGQASLFLPSYTADPLLQIYLGSRTVVQEVSATLLQQTSREAHESFRRLWKASLARPPTIVVVLKVSALGSSEPDVIRQQAQLIRGKINLLSELFEAPIRTRLCLTNMERIRGYSEFARFLHKQRLPLVLDVGADADLVSGFAAYEKYVPRALTTLPVGSFESGVSLLSAAETVMAPVRTFVTALVEGSVASVRPDIQRVYFFSLPPDEQVGNPFDSAGLSPAGVPTALSRFHRWLVGLGIRPLHAVLCLLLLLLGLVPVLLGVQRHDQRVQQAVAATWGFQQAVRRAQETLSSPSESDVVRRAEQAAAQALTELAGAEARWRALRLLQRPEKAALRSRFIESVRQGYLRPALELGVRQRGRDKILYGMAALYATRDNSLGALVRAQPQEFSATLGLPLDLILDYVQNSDAPYSERVLLLLPPLPSESRWPIADLGPWRAFLTAVTQATAQPAISPEPLEALRKEAGRLEETITRVRKATTMRRIFQMLSEESPLDLTKLFGRDAGALAPDPWLHDNQELLERLLRLVRESSIQINKHGHLSLYQLLKWINSLSPDGERAALGTAGEPTASAEPLHFAFPGNQLFEISERAWLELLMRSRKRLLLANRITGSDGSSARAHRHRAARCCDCQHTSRRHKRRHPCRKCDGKNDGTCTTQRKNKRVPPFTNSELQPRLASLLNSAQTAGDALTEEYNRTLFDHEVLPMLRELRRALADSKNLTAEEKLRLARLVRGQVQSYAQKYCSSLMKFYLSYHFHRSAGDLHSALLNVVRPGSPFVAHLFAVADNAALRGLDDPYLAPLGECLAEFKPIVQIMIPKEPDKKPPPKLADAKPADAKPAETKSADAKSADAKPAAPAPFADRPTGNNTDRESEGLADYLGAVAKLAEELDANPSMGDESKGGGKKGDPPQVLLAAQLSGLGRSALAVAKGQDGTPRQSAEKFLDKAGIIGALRRPFMAPFDAVYHRGAREIEGALAQHWQNDTLPMVAQLLTRFPFNQSAEREVAPSELEVLNEKSGAFFQDVRSFYEPVLIEQSGVYRARPGALGPLALPKELLPTVNQLTRLARALFNTGGERQPLRFAVRGVAGSRVNEDRQVQPTVAFLQVGKTSVYGFNQRPSADTLAISWWESGAAIVGIESLSARSGRKHTQTLEVADSAWSLYRLLQKSTLGPDGVSTWRILDDGAGDGQAIRFLLDPDPWALFRVRLR